MEKTICDYCGTLIYKDEKAKFKDIMKKKIIKSKEENQEMKEVYIKKTDLNRWVAKYFNNQDLITIEELIGCIEDLDSEVEHLKEEVNDLKEEAEENWQDTEIF